MGPLRSPAGPSGEPRRHGRWWRWVVRALVGLVVLVVVLVGAVFAVLGSLDRPWLKGRLQALARTSGGVEVDYRTAQIALFSGADIEGLVVRSPPQVRAFAPDLVRIEHLDVRWSLGALMHGAGPVVPHAEVSGVTLAVVIDEAGKTSFDWLFPPASPPPPPSAPVPLSHLPSKLLGAPLPVGQVDVRGVTLDLVRTDHGVVSERTELQGLALSVSTSSAEPAQGWRVQAGLGSSAKPSI